jgi:transportin-3
VCLQQALAERNGGAGVPEGEHNDGEEDAKGMARLFAEVGEAYTGLIAEGGPQVGTRHLWRHGAAQHTCHLQAPLHSAMPRHALLGLSLGAVVCRTPGVSARGPPPQVSAPLEALLDVASHPDDAICSMSFNFWHRLARALTIGLHPEPLGAAWASPAASAAAGQAAAHVPLHAKLRLPACAAP